MTTNREKHYEAWETRRRIAGRRGLRGALLVAAIVAARVVVGVGVVGVVG